VNPDLPNPEVVAASQDGLDLELLGVLESYLAGVEQGEHADPEAIIAAHPDIAERLRGCLASLRFLGGTSEAFRADLVTDHEDSAHSRTAAKRLGDYCILREIGRGGMGVVYEAEQVSLGRRVALKVLPFAAALDARQIARFKNEAHAAAQLHHTNIVPVFAVGCDQGVYYYAMQLIEGQSLSQVIRELRESSGLPADAARAVSTVSSVSRSLSAGDFAPPASAPRGAPVKNGASTETASSTHLTASSDPGSTRRAVFFRSVARIWLQAAEALEHAHALGIVHRDLKPGNFLLDVRGTLWVADFGLARCQSDASITVSGDVLGTLRYMSPEQALARRGGVDHRSDIYSLGATIYELLTLEPAVAGSDRHEILRRIANDEPASPRRLNRSIPVDLETIVLESMSKEPDGRYQSARELADDLRRFLDDVPIHARRISLLGRTLRWAKRRRGPVSAVTVITLLGLFAAVLGYWRWSEAREIAYREAIESAVGKIGLAGIVMNALMTESSEGLRVSDNSLRLFRSEGMDGLLESVDEAIDELDLAERILPDRPEAPYHRAQAHAVVRREAEARSSSPSIPTSLRRWRCALSSTSGWRRDREIFPKPRGSARAPRSGAQASAFASASKAPSPARRGGKRRRATASSASARRRRASPTSAPLSKRRWVAVSR